MADSTRSYAARTASNTSRIEERQRQAQARLSDLAFARFVAEHNARQLAPFEPARQAR